jgi:hypothetical protein
MKEDLESSHSKQVIVTQYEKLQLGNNQIGKKLDKSDLSSSSTLLNTGHFNNNNNANANVSFRKENNQSKNLAIKNLFKENTNSQRSGSANSLISNLKNDSTSSNGLMTTLIKLNHHR